MRTVPFSAVMNGILARMGYDPTIPPAANTLAAFTEYINSTVRVTWEMYPWPEFLNFEQRQFYPSWSVSSYYLPGTFVLGSNGTYFIAVAASSAQDPTLDTAHAFWTPAGNFQPRWWSPQTIYPYGQFVVGSDQNFYVCSNTNGSTGNNPVTDGGVNWTLLTSPAVGFNIGSVLFAISLDQPGQTPIGEVINVTAADPRTSRVARSLNWQLTENGIVIRPRGYWMSAIPATVWVEFTSRPQQYTAASYTNGDTIPWVLAESVKYGACACAHREDGQFDKATVMDQLSADVLDDEFDKIEMKQQQSGSFACLSR